MSQPRQILHVIGQLDGYGLTRQLELLAARQLAEGNCVRVVALAAKTQALRAIERQAIRCDSFERRWRCDPIAAVRLARELRRAEYDVLHLWGEAAVQYVRATQKLLPARPTLASSRTETTVSDQSPTNMLPGIAPLPAPTCTRAKFLAEQKLPDDARLIAVAGPLTRPQQVDEAIWYFELLRTLDKRVRLLVFGDGPDRHRLERFSRLTSEPSAIRFLGYRDDFRELLPHVDLFWQTAIASDATPLTLLEAMAAGVPVVANNGAECRLAIDDGTNGYLVPDKDRASYARQSRKLLYDNDQAERFKTAAAATVAERFSVDAMTQAYGDLYADLLSG